MPERPDGDPDPEPLVPDMDQTFHKSARSGSRSRNSAGCWSYLSKRLSNNNDVYKVHAFLNDNDVLDGHISAIFMFLWRHDSHGQCFGSGFGWTRVQFGPGSSIGIRIRNPDPDSGSRCLKIDIKSQNLLWVIVFVTLWRWEQKSALINTVKELFIPDNFFFLALLKSYHIN
jgi:hypothetical protein